MSNLEVLRQVIADCPAISLLTDDIHIDWTNSQADSYGIMPTGRTENIIAKYIDGSKRVGIQEDYSLYIRKYTLDDFSRLESSNFNMSLQEYLVDISLDNFSGENKQISANNGSMFEIDEDSASGLYLIQINLTYEKEK